MSHQRSQSSPIKICNGDPATCTHPPSFHTKIILSPEQERVVSSTRATFIANKTIDRTNYQEMRAKLASKSLRRL